MGRGHSKEIKDLKRRREGITLKREAKLHVSRWETRKVRRGHSHCRVIHKGTEDVHGAMGTCEFDRYGTVRNEVHAVNRNDEASRDRTIAWTNSRNRIWRSDNAAHV
jgi:hypothetical protein